MTTLLLTVLVAVTALLGAAAARFHVVREWKYINFSWPDEEALLAATSRGQYVPENNVISDVAYHDNYYYLTLPRMKSGVPATLARVPAGTTRDTAPPLAPFPSWAMNAAGECDALQNVQNVEIDARGLLWIIDGGRIQTLNNPIAKCAPKLLIYDLNVNRIHKLYIFPEEVAPKNGSFLYDLVVDHTDGGFAYITDNSANDPGIIVYSFRANRSWKIRHPKTMVADPSASDLFVNGIPITASINLAGIALGPTVHVHNQSATVATEDRKVYYAPLTSLSLYAINSSVLKSEQLSASPQVSDELVENVGLKASQSVGMMMDNAGVLYYSLLGNNGIGRWDSTATSFQSGQKIIAQDAKYIEWPNSFTIDNMGNLTVVMNRLNRFIFDHIVLDEPNFRLIAAQVGGESYLFDGNYDYSESTDGGRSSIQDVPSSPEPTPGDDRPPSSNNFETNNGTIDEHHNHNHHHHMTRDSGCNFLANLFMLVITVALFLT